MSKRVAVLSYANIGNFGDRLGYHLVNGVVPPSAEVQHLFFEPWTPIDIERYDLLIVGIGNSIFRPLLTDPLQDLVTRAPRAIGVFGTQYRRAIPEDRLAALLGGLDMWFARSAEDIQLYGHHARAVTHLGDWLIEAFPMTRAPVNDRLAIGSPVLNNLPLDRIIQEIQRHQRVFSPRLHPLLCALTSAREVEYAEQREQAGSDEVSGKFGSMLLDIFGQTYPENTPWTVDRAKVVAYKEQVAANVAGLKRYIAEALA